MLMASLATGGLSSILLYLLHLKCPQFVHCQPENFNSSTFLMAPLPKANAVCANSGRFLGSYCLADYNCHQGRPASKQICIRGRCCTKTTTRKALVNRRTDEDRACPRGSFNVQLSCKSTVDCLRKAALPLNSPLPLLECVARAGHCCTSSRYRKPLAKSAWCLNGGKALGRMNGFRRCVIHQDCRNQQRPRAHCVDGQCCTAPVRRKGDGADNPFDDVDDSNGGNDDEEGFEDSREQNDDNWSMENRDFNEDDDNIDDYDSGGRIPRKSALQEGRRICRRYGLQYPRVQRCSRRFKCANGRRFRCVSGHCCLRRLPTTINPQSIDEFEDDFLTDRNGNSGRVPSGPGGFCVGTGRFRRFLGQHCRLRVDCPRVLDARRQVVPIRCIRGACCAALRRRRPNQADDPPEEGGTRILPIRPRGSYAFCFDGTLSNSDCLSSEDCPVPNRQICENGLCCAPGIDQEKYACGGLASAGQCTAALSLLSSAGCRDNLFCVSPGACCECRHGQPQRGVADCRGRRELCHSGYACDLSSGFCCPRCADGQRPFGSCHLGKCARGFSCHPGNICCPAMDSDFDGFDDGEDDGLFEDDDYLGYGWRRRRLDGTRRNPLGDWDF